VTAGESERARLLGMLGDDIVSIFPRLQREITVPHEQLIHVTRSEADVLRIIVLEPGSTVSHIAQAIGQHRSNTSMRIAHLVDKGLIEKRSVADDGREVRVFPTVRARDNFEGYRRLWSGVLAEVSTASDEELAVAAKVLTEMAEHLAVWRAGLDAAATSDAGA
jgi:DNA-binding MarR family transcriptional regulator